MRFVPPTPESPRPRISLTFRRLADGAAMRRKAHSTHILFNHLRVFRDGGVRHVSWQPGRTNTSNRLIDRLIALRKQKYSNRCRLIFFVSWADVRDCIYDDECRGLNPPTSLRSVGVCACFQLFPRLFVMLNPLGDRERIKAARYGRPSFGWWKSLSLFSPVYLLPLFKYSSAAGAFGCRRRRVNGKSPPQPSICNQGTPTLIYTFNTCRRDVGHYANNPLPTFCWLQCIIRY